MGKQRPHFLLPIAMFGIATLFYLYEFLLRVAPSVMFAELMADFQLDAKKFGIFSSSYYWSYAALQVPIGALTDRYGPRRLLTFAIVLCGASTFLSAFTTSFYVACLLRFFIGAGSAFAFICCMKIIVTWFRASLFPLMTGLTLTIGTLGAVASAPVSYSLNYVTWQTLFMCLGCIGFVMAIFSWILVRDHNPIRSDLGEDQAVSTGAPLNVWNCLKEIAKWPQNWLVAIYAFLITAPTDAFGGAWGVQFLSQVHHIARDQAALAVSMTFLGLACGSPFIGWLAGRWGCRRKPMFLSSFLACFFLVVLIYIPALSAIGAGLLYFLFGFWGVYVLSFIVIRELNPGQYVATAVGFVNMLSMLGSALLTYLIGFVLDTVRSGEVIAGEPVYTSGDYHLGLLLVPVFYAVSALLIVPFIKEHVSQNTQ